MRNELISYENEIVHVVGQIESLGFTNNQYKMLIYKVQVNNNILYDHCWVDYIGTGIFQIGTWIEFNATVYKYHKSIHNKLLYDYGLHKLRDLHILEPCLVS